ncbi:MAG: DUF1926 domain-containing protein, partial [Candidatus Omnitrophica bacterium]|nr:DUF1926 domain-containing protein [Candidatus Omnitrophota bacterium]
YKLVYTKGWLRKFFLLLKENSAWLETVTYSDLLDSAETKDVGEVPMSSYSEMMEWSGGNFRNFLKKYPEAERMHSRMIGVSETISNIFLEDLTDEKYREAETAKKELFKAQSGCAYWHGAFGGVYLPHLREGVYKHLIRSQGIIDTFEAGNGKSICIVEHDSDKNETETAIRNNFMDVYFESCGGGKIKELDHKVRGINLTNIISRSKEKYHKKLNRGYFKKIKKARCLAFKGETVDIHDILGVKDRGLKKILFYDKKERTSFNTHLFTDSFSLRDMYRGRTGNNAFLNGTYKSDIQVEGSVANAWFSKEDVIKKDRGKEFRVEVEKRVIVGTKPEIKFYHKTVSQIEIQCAIEYNFLIWDKWSGKIPRHVKTDKFLLRDQYSGLGLEFSFNKKLNVFTYPIFTINESEMGLKKTFQGICLFVSPIGRNKENSTDVMEINLKLG